MIVEFLHKAILILHILSGSVALLSGLVVMILRKGTRMHKNIGRVFYYAMNTTGCAALLLAILNPHAFLFIVGVFSLYLNLSGRRMILLYQKGPDARVERWDYLLSAGMLLAAMAFLFLGFLQLLRENSFGWVYLAFGSLGLFLLYVDIRSFRKSSETSGQRVASHLTKMTGAYIAACTAFLVVNNTWLPGILAWLGPSLLGTLLIIYWSRKLAPRY